MRINSDGSITEFSITIESRTSAEGGVPELKIAHSSDVSVTALVGALHRAAYRIDRDNSE